MGTLDAIPENLQSYFRSEAYLRDTKRGGDGELRARQRHGLRLLEPLILIGYLGPTPEGTAMKKLSGWWRLWIALSLVWAVIIAVMFVTSWKDYGAGDRLRDGVHLHCTTALDGHEIDWSLIPAGQISAAVAAVSAPGAVPPPQPAPSTPAPATTAEYGWGPVQQPVSDSVELLLVAREAQGTAPNEAKSFITACLAAKQRDYEVDVVQQRHFTMLVAFCIIVAPPALILILGFLVCWVIAGFRKSRGPV
jgi:hypothetical protein